MKLILKLICLLIIPAFYALCSCASDAIDETPQSIASFITQYFPNQRVESYTPVGDGNHEVKLANSATLVFDKENRWIEIDGEGMTLPEVLLYDQLPPALFSYLQASEQQREVYAVKRDFLYYKLTMTNTVLTYTISSGTITYPGEQPGNNDD